MQERVLIFVPNDFRVPPRERFKEAQWKDAELFASICQEGEHEVELVRVDLFEPVQANTVVKEAVARFKPTRVIIRSYLWADPPNGLAVFQQVDHEIPVAISGMTAAVGEPLGEAPGEVFMFHLSCNAEIVGRDHTRLFGPLTGEGSEETRRDIKEFIAHGKVITDVEFKDFKLPITAKHKTAGELNREGLRGKILAITGGNCMGMHSNQICIQSHLGSGPAGGWRMNIPIIPPDLFDWNRRVLEKEAHYLSLGAHYVSAMVAKGFTFLFQRDEKGEPYGEDENDYNPLVAARQMGFYAAMLDMQDEIGFELLGIPAQLLMTKHLFPGDLIKGVAMSSWGPEGRNKPLFWETEGDMEGCISSWLLYQTTGHVPIFCDVRCPIPDLGSNTWMMCNSGAAAADGADGGWESCFSARQYKGYFDAPGGTFAFRNPKKSFVVGLRTATDRNGRIYATIAIGETVRSDDPKHMVDGRWPQYKVEIWDSRRKTYLWLPTNHYHWAESDDPIRDACVLSETVRLAGGRVGLLWDGRQPK